MWTETAEEGTSTDRLQTASAFSFFYLDLFAPISFSFWRLRWKKVEEEVARRRGRL